MGHPVDLNALTVGGVEGLGHGGVVVDTMYEEFLAHPRMTGVRGRAVWIHVDVPGQGKHQPDLPLEYVLCTPTDICRRKTLAN